MIPLLFALKLLLTPTPMWFVYSYDRTKQDGVMVEVYKICENCKTPPKLVWTKELKLVGTEMDSVFIKPVESTDVYQVFFTGIKRGYVCDTFTDTMKEPYFRKSYGLNFQCEKAIASTSPYIKKYLTYSSGP